jgi:hypothetical protein
MRRIGVGVGIRILRVAQVGEPRYHLLRRVN